MTVSTHRLCSVGRSQCSSAWAPNATVSDVASRRPSPASTTRSMSGRMKNRPGYSLSCQIDRIEERSASTQKTPATVSTTNAMSPAVPRASRSDWVSSRGRFSAR